MLLLQVASLVIGISLLAPRTVVEATLLGQNSDFFGADPNAPSSKGNEFVLGFMGNTANAPIATATAAVFVTTDDPSPVEFTVEYFGRTDTYEARRGTTTLARLPVSATNAQDIRIATENERNKGVRIKATDSSKLLTVYGINDAAVSTDAFLALPCHRYPVIDYRYFVFSTFTQISTGTFQSRFLIVPCEDDTTVTLQPTQQVQLQPDLTGQRVPISVQPGATSVAITMDRLQTAQFNSANDLTGTIITSNKPISVFVGHECGQVPGDRTACDHLVEQVPPEATWGTQFFTAPLDIRESGERYRVGTVADNNQVTITCTTEGQSMPRLQMTQTLRSQPVGQNFLEFDTIGDIAGPANVGRTPTYRRDFCCIETSQPAIVMMYSKGHSVDEITLEDVTGTQGDPFMLLIPPLSQYSNDYTATTAKQVRTDFIGHYSLTIPIQFFDNSSVDRSLLLINDSTSMPVSGYQRILCANNQTCGYGAYSNLSVGNHLVRYNKPGAAMNLFVYGFLREISFGYPTGFEMQAVGAPRVTIFNITVLESVGMVTIPINRTGGDLSLVTVIRATSRDVPGQAVAGSDYQSLSNFRIRWLRGAVNPRYIPNPTNPDPTFQFTIIDDSVREPTEYFEIDLIPNPGGNGNAFFYPSAVGRVTIIDNDSPPEIGFVPESYEYDENAGVARLTIRTNMPERFTDATGALFYTDDGNATGGGVDYSGYTRGNAIPITFPDGSTDTVIEVNITNDRLVEGTERFFGRIISGGGITGLNIIAPTATVDIRDNDRVVFGFEQPMYMFAESVGTGNLGVRLSPDSGQLAENLVFTFSTADDTAIAPGDYASVTMLYTFMPGQARLDIPVTIVDDSVFEGSERFRGILSTTADAVIDVPQTIVSITDNDRINIGFDPVSYSRSEDDRFVDLTFRKFSNPPTLMENITVIFSTSDGTAIAGSDYTAVSGFEVTFLPEEDTKTVQVMITDDADLESLENFFGNLMISTDSASIAQVTVPQATVNITDNDERIEVGFDPITYPVTEGDIAMLRVVLNMAYTDEITVSLQTNDGSAIDGEDYSGVTTVVTFAPGEIVKIVNVSTIDDGNSESTESFTATLSNASPSNVVAITQPMATVNIADNDQVLVSFERPSYTVDESSNFVMVCFMTNTGHPDRPIAVTIQPRELSTSSPECTEYPSALVGDFADGSLSQTFIASPVGGLLCANISLVPDSLYEGNEQFVVGFTNVPDAANRVGLGAISQACVTIRDNDVRTFDFEFPNITIPEPNGSARICIRIDGGTLVPINVTASTGPKTGPSIPQATADSDYESRTFSLIFLPSDEGTMIRCANVPIIDDRLGNEEVEAFSVSIDSITPEGQQGSSRESCVFIVDDDVPEIFWIDGNVTVPEGDDRDLCYMSNIGTARSYEVRVGVRGKGANPASASDFVVVPPLDFTFSSPNPEIVCLNLSTIDDSIDEPTEQLEFFFSNLPSGSARLGVPPTACVNIEDNDMPVAQWELPEVNIPEGETEQVCFTRSADSAQSYEIRVGVRPKGSRPATGGVDYSILSALTFNIEPTSLRRHCVAVSIIEDEIGEGMEQFELFFENLPSESAGVGTPATTCVNIIDDDVAEVNIEMGNVTVPESDPMVEICFTLSSGVAEQVVVTAETRSKTGAADQATAGMDYTPTVLMVTFESSNTGNIRCDNVSIINDDLGNEGDELFSVVITNVSSNKVLIGPNRESCVTIVDDDKPEIEWNESVVNITEGENRQICFSSDIGSDVSYEVVVGINPKGSNPATQGTDYRIDSSLTIIIPATDSGSQHCLDVSTIEDNIAENTEQFELSFANLPTAFATAGMRDTVCVNIVDDEDPETNVEVPDIDVPENETEVEICISVSTGISKQVIVTAETRPKAGSSNPATAESDYTTTPLMLTFEPSSDGRMVCGKVPIIDDKLANEGTEQFSVRITGTSDPRIKIGSNAETCVNIIDDDVPVVTWNDREVSINESDSRMVCFSSDIGTDQSYNVMVGARGKGASPAIRDGDYSLPAASLSVSFSSSMPGEQFCIDISTIDDSTGEGTEQFELYFENLPSASARDGDPNVLCVNILDNDAPVVGPEKPEIEIPENETEVEVCYMLSTGITGQVVITLMTGPKTGAANEATAGSDYQNTTFDLTFEPSAGSQRACGKVPITDDLLDEPNEQFSVRIVGISGSSSNVIINSNNETCVTIIDDDVPEIKWEEPEVTIPEGGGRLVCFTTSIGSVAPYQIMVGVRGKGDPAATQSEDYTIVNSLTFTVPASDSGRRFCVNVSTIDDTKVEGTEQFELYFENVPSATTRLGTPGSTCVNIADDDVLNVSFERDQYTVIENAGSVRVCFLTNIGHTDDVLVTVTPVDKPGAQYPAASDSDYSSTLQSRTFVANATGNTLCVDIAIIDDTLDEFDEQFLVRFGNLPNAQAQLGPIPEACITITDDDVPVFNIDPPMRNVTEPDGGPPEVEICITTSSPLARSVVVTARTGPKSGATHQATADADYESRDIVVTFTPSDDGSTQRRCGNVSIINDTIGNEPNEEFSVTLVSTTPPGGSFDDRESCITIIDDDVVGINFSTMDVTVNENNGTVTVCLTKNITTAGEIVVVFDAEEERGVPNPASNTSDFESGFGMLRFAPDQLEACGQVRIKNDDDPETPEVFMVTFMAANLVIPRPPDLPPPVAEVTIIDDDQPVDVLTCRIDEIMQVQPFTRMSDYRFMGICEFTAVSSCIPVPGFDIRVTVDYITETLENGAVGLHVNNLRYVSREDGTFDDGGQTPISSTPSSAEYAATDPTLVRVSMGSGQTNITFDSNIDPSDPLDADIEIIHNWGDANPNILISIRTPNNSAISNFCGLCGSRSGSLLRRDGTEADATNMAEVQSFAESYSVPARDQILRPQRGECGTIRNDTVIGDPLYAAPVYSEDGKEYSLCYEVFGRANSTLNLVSDTCVSVNARYGPMDNPADGNIIRAIGVRARGLSEASRSCHNIRVDLEGCSATVETPDGNSQSLGSMERFESDGISVRKYPSRVRISAPNCENVMLVMWVICENRNNQDMIKFVIARGLNLRPSSHGLLGQFWNIPVTFTQYNGTDLPAGTDPSRVYTVTVDPESSPARSFLGHFYHLKWDKSREPCLYVGNAQGGPSFEVLDPNDSIIEGHYRDYIFQGGDGNLFETSYTYSQFEESRCT